MVFTSQSTEPQQVTTHFTEKTASDVPYYGYRYYSTEMGRWVSRDPIEELGGINVYGFAENAPTTFVDYIGQKWWWPSDWFKKISTNVAALKILK
jgi:RHS repeat-associated protein